MYLKIILLIFITKLSLIQQFKQCEKRSHRLSYFKLKSCHKSTLPVTFWKNVNSVVECKKLSREKNGLAFNFNPPEAKDYLSLLIPNCQVLGCPDINNSSLVMDLAYDYYSAYGNLNSSKNNYTCINSLGVFSLTSDTQNYTRSIMACQNMSGDLADVTSESRTQFLSQIINGSVKGWYKAAYVGLDNIRNNGMFKTSFGRLLTCSHFRAWAPGHPISKFKTDICVTLDSTKLWRVVKCNKVKLKGLCEIFTHPPDIKNDVNVPKNVTCKHISNKKHKEKRKCLQEKKLFQVYQNSSRADRCALLNYKY